MTIEVRVGSWRARAACRGLDTALFYPERGEPTAEAKEACRSCPVREECLEEALDNTEKFGIWGGMAERQRRMARRGRRRRSAA